MAAAATAIRSERRISAAPRLFYLRVTRRHESAFFGAPSSRRSDATRYRARGPVKGRGAVAIGGEGENGGIRRRNYRSSPRAVHGRGEAKPGLVDYVRLMRRVASAKEWREAVERARLCLIRRTHIRAAPPIRPQSHFKLGRRFELRSPFDRRVLVAPLISSVLCDSAAATAFLQPVKMLRKLVSRVAVNRPSLGLVQILKYAPSSAIPYAEYRPL